MAVASHRQRVQQLQYELTQRQQDIRSKRECLQELMAQNVCFQNLLGRNHTREVEAQKMMMRYNSVCTRQGHIQHEYNGGGTQLLISMLGSILVLFNKITTAIAK